MNGMLELFKVGASLVLDKSGFDSDVRAADAAGKGLSESLSKHMEKAKKVIKGLFSVGAVVAATKAVWNLAKETSAAGDRIDKQSQALGMSRKAFQEWDYILRQSGASIDDLGLTMKTMSAAIMENSADTAAGLSKLGLSAAQLQNMSAEEQFETLVKAFQEMPEGVEKSQLAIQLFGRNAQSLMPLLNSASGSVDELRNRAHDLGLIMSDEDVDSAVAFGDALDDLNAVWTALKQKFGAQLLPGFTKGIITLANSLGRISNALTKAFKEGDWKGLFSTITEEISALLPQAIDTISGMILGLFENADKIIDLGISLVNGLVDGVAKAAPTLIQKLPQILSKAWESIKSMGLKLGNVLIDAINAVLGTNIPHLDEIRWPTWPEVQLAFSNAWKFIQDEAEKLMKLIFGETEDGGIDWPEASEIWEKVKTGADTLWKGLQTLLGGIFKFIFGETEDGGIDWPEASEIWEKVKTGADILWNGLQTLLGGIFKFIFGETADGGIKWPTAAEIWLKIKSGLEKLWEGIMTFAKFVLKLAFGETADGGIKWPTAAEIWLKIKSGLEALWEGVKSYAKFILKFVFGETADGGVKWPTAAEVWLKIKSGLDTMWQGVSSLASSILKLVFGETKDGGVKWPTPAELWLKIKAGFVTLWDGITTLLFPFFKLQFGEAADGGIKWPTPAELWLKIKSGFDTLWSGIKTLLFPSLKLEFGSTKDGGVTWPEPAEVWAKISEGFDTFWNGLATSMQAAATWTIGLFDTPPVRDAIKKINDWWFGTGEEGSTGVVGQISDFMKTTFGIDPPQVIEDIRKWWGGDSEAGTTGVLGQISDFMKATFGLDFPDVVQQIIDWWNNTVVAGVGNLLLSFGITPGGSPTIPVEDAPDIGINGQGSDESSNPYGSNGYWNPFSNSWEELPYPHAKGLNYVPYDGYVAVLHRGETILNQNQGREWRQNGGAGIDFDALAAAVSGAVAEAVSNIQLNMDGKAVGSAVAGQVSREITRSMMGRRVPAL